ncbi:ABC transporter permease [Yinghuangia sp. ASG 101]|nr:ABC transporter permease [Yinghuangia sp. ASG 101]UGQ15671.1 ABC transporter permease [Yinghuangia sp. ASG 101]
MITAWSTTVAVVVLGSARSFTALYDTPAERADLARSTNDNASLRAFYGPVFAWDSGGALTAWRFTVIGAVLVGLMAALIVVRHTRDEEETGRQELVAAGAVGRLAPLSAALLTATAASTAVAAPTALGLLGSGDGAAGALALGLCLVASGVVFAAVAALSAQLATTGRAARGMAGAVLGAAFLVRAAGDAASRGASSALIWTSPLGWIEQVRPYGGDRWWALPLPIVFAGVVAAAAYALVTRRDLGAAMLATRNGRATAGRSLSGPFGLAWRLHRGALLGWGIALLAAGAVYGGVAGGVDDLIGDNRDVSDIVARMGGGGSLTDAFLASAMGLLGLLAAVFAVQCVLRMRAEETGGRAAPLLTGPVPRVRWVASHLVFAVLGPVVLLAVGGLSAGIAHGARVPDLVAAAIAQAPAAWVVAAAATAVFGLLPRATPAAWALVAACGVLDQLGPALELPRSIMDASPFSHLPKLPGDTATAAPYAILTAVATALLVAGITGTRHRDIG